MKRGTSQAGFTIVEVLIVLAVTGLLFAMIAASFVGRQNGAEFNQTIQDVRIQIQQALSEVQTGFYPNISKLTCKKNGAGALILKSDATSTTDQGTNKDCIFLGKVLQFAVDAPDTYVIYPVAGLRGAADSPITALSDDAPTVIAPTPPSPNIPDDSQTVQLNYGLSVVAMNAVSKSGVHTKIGAVGFISSLGAEQTSDSGTSYTPGSIQVDFYGLPDTGLGQDKQTAAKKINAALLSAVANSGRIDICFQSGGTKQYGLITIGQKNRQLSVDLQIQDITDDNVNCGLSS